MKNLKNLKFLKGYQFGRNVRTTKPKELVQGVSLEGLCALLNALQRLKLHESLQSLLISPAAVERVSRSKLSASHLGHFCYIFSQWLQNQDKVEEDEKRVLREDLRRSLRQQVLKLFSLTLCPAILEADLQRPKHVAMMALALARLGSAGQTTAESMAQQLSKCEKDTGMGKRKAHLCDRKTCFMKLWLLRSSTEFYRVLGSVLSPRVQNKSLRRPCDGRSGGALIWHHWWSLSQHSCCPNQKLPKNCLQSKLFCSHLSS